MSFVQVDATQFLTTDLNQFDVLFVGWDGDAFNPAPFNSLLTRQVDIAKWVASGHAVVALAEPNLGRFSWLPLNVTIANEFGDQVVITNPSHPVMANLTNALLSNWGSSYHNYFTSWAPAYQILDITPLHTLPLTLVASLGSGRIAITGQDPDFHLYYQHRPGAAILLRNMINWAAGVSAAPSGETNLSISPIVTTLPKGSIFSDGVNITSAFNLYSFDIFLTFDPTILTASSPIDSGGVLRAYCLKTAGCTGVSSSITAGSGFVEEKQSLTGMIPGFSGNGTLFTALFAASKSTTGTSVIHIASNGSAGGNGIMKTGTGSQIQHFSVDGVFSDNGPDLFVSVVPNILTIADGSRGVSRVTLYSLNGLSGAVSLTLTGVPLGVNAIINQTSLPLTGSQASTIISIQVSSTASPGIFNLTVTGTITPKAHQTISSSGVLALLVPPPRPDFSVSISSASVNIPAGASRSVSITVSSINGFSSPVTLSLQGLPFFGGLSGSFIINPVTPSTGASASSTLILFVSQFLFPQTIPLTVTASSPGITHSQSLTVIVSGFGFSPFISSLAVQPGGSTSATLTLVPSNNFTGTVQLSALLVPNNVTITLSTTTLTVPPAPGSSLTFRVTFQASPIVPLGSFETVILGTSGPTVGSAVILIQIDDFSIALANPEIALPISESRTASVFLASLNGFTGPVSLQVSGLPTGVTVAGAPALLFLNPDATLDVPLVITATKVASIGSFPLTITASSGNRTLSTVLAVHITDFALSASANSLSLRPSQSANVTLSVNSLNGFSLPVNFTVSGLPTGITGTIATSTVSTVGGSATATLTVTVPKKPLTSGAFLLTITAASGSLSHTLTIILTVL